jgi:hypothetical protein
MANLPSVSTRITGWGLAQERAQVLRDASKFSLCGVIIPAVGIGRSCSLQRCEQTGQR